MKRMYPPDGGLKEQVREFEYSVFEVIKRHFLGNDYKNSK